MEYIDLSEKCVKNITAVHCILLIMPLLQRNAMLVYECVLF